MTTHSSTYGFCLCLGWTEGILSLFFCFFLFLSLFSSLSLSVSVSVCVLLLFVCCAGPSATDMVGSTNVVHHISKPL